MYTLSIQSMKESKVKLEHLAALYESMMENKDEDNAQKIFDLYVKKKAKEKIISFSGHFSAGKSSMINALIGNEILPKSPIPTSANIVKLTSGKGVARIYFHDDNPVEYKEPYDLSMIKDFCKDKNSISKIELSTANCVIPLNSAIFDTPGIDAADDADRLITESSLHLVDHMFYVVDYNHVQSEVNLQFMQSIQKMNIPYYLIVNQVDKHNEEELTFSTFKNNIKQTFDQWNVKPNKVYFTSLVDDTGEYNQFTELKREVFSLLNSELEDLPSIENSVRHLVEKHISFLNDSLEDEVYKLNLKSEKEPDVNRLNELIIEIDKLRNKPSTVESLFRTELNHTLKNAYLMPAVLREQAKSFLESQQKDFKVGWLGSKKKTSLERENRTTLFLNSLQDSIETNIQWKVRDKLQQLIKENDLESHACLAEKIQQLNINYTINDLNKLINSGAKVNGDYILNYTKDVSNDVIQKYKQEINTILQQIHDLIEEDCVQTLDEYKREQQRIEKDIEDKKRMSTLHQSLSEKLTKISKLMELPDIQNEVTIQQLNQKIEKQLKAIVKVGELEDLNKNPSIIKPSTNKSAKIRVDKQSASSVIHSIDEVINTVNQTPGFDSVIADLEDKRKRLKNRKFTIALFGAFSAGKSSFANALLGASLLPTSPNPTTAVINKITAPNNKFNHETVIIKLKDESTLLNDIKPIIRPISKHTQSFNELSSVIAWISKNIENFGDKISKVYQSFLLALLDGFNAHKLKIGESIEINIADFDNYVTDESKACYIEEVTLYYDCPITQKGITLVDTPGADSINARHTNVSFDYIKHADSILYVTYYNHALSRADKDFLQQLGRVKESFELDKMNFIINAADLAANPQEVDLVSNYVQEQLLALDIRNPKIYPLSSKDALDDSLRQRDNKQMDRFTNDLFNFIEYDLTGVIIQSATHEMNRAKQLLANFIETINLDVQEKEHARINLLKSQEKMETAVHYLTGELYIKQIAQKIEKQLYYVEQRLSIRFHDMFKEMFNPATITETGRKSTLQLENSMRQLLDYVGYELLQEIRAVSLRIEALMRELLLKANNEIVDALKEVEPKFIASSANKEEWETPIFEIAFEQLEVTVFKNDLSIFRGTKSFFVKNEKDIMKEAIYDTLTQYIKQYIIKAHEDMQSSYSSQLQNSVKSRNKALIIEISSFIDNNLEMMSTTINMNELKRKHAKIESILS